MTAQTTQRAGKRGEWEQRMADFQASGLTQQAFCAREGVPYSRFAYWRRQLRAEPVVTTNEAPPTLIEVPLQSTDTWRIELDLGDGLVLRIR